MATATSHREQTAQRMIRAWPVVLGVLLGHNASAAPPLLKTPESLRPVAVALTHAAGSNANGHLDLRPPTTVTMASSHANDPVGADDTLPMARRGFAGFGNRGGTSHDGPNDTRGLVALHPAGVQDFVRRVRHEGLPIARLWENHSAMLSVGLSPKGKPGLWLVQKVP